MDNTDQRGLSLIEKRLINALGGDIGDGPRPFAGLGCRLGISEAEVIEVIRGLRARGLLRRFGATLRHQKSGFTANAMVAWRVPEDEAERVGGVMAGFPEVTHCYQRRIVPGWPYNLYTMIHAVSDDEIEALAERLSAAVDVGRLPDPVQRTGTQKDIHALFRAVLTGGVSMNETKSGRLFEEAKKVIPGGGQQSGQGMPVRGRRAPVHQPRPGGQDLGRGRQRIHRLRRVLGPHDPGTQPPGRHPGGHPGPGKRRFLRRPHRSRNHPGQDARLGHAVHGNGPAGQFRHRGDHERGAVGPRVHRTVPHREVRRLLSRARRRHAGRRRFRRGHAGHPRQPGRARTHRRPDPFPAVQRSRRRGPGLWAGTRPRSRR